ncbi:unnamed protein product [Dicrocoelium dendriticum]|nr:unnamed protein product [Dicrocoelium dendriticum]
MEPVVFTSERSTTSLNAQQELTTSHLHTVEAVRKLSSTKQPHQTYNLATESASQANTEVSGEISGGEKKRMSADFNESLHASMNGRIPGKEATFNHSKRFCYQSPIIQQCLGNHKSNLQSSKNIGPKLTWYFDLVELECHSTSDCITNENAFASQEDCELTCIPTPDVRKCLAPPKAGYYHCLDQQSTQAVNPVLMVYFDKTAGKCHWFTFYGCGGTSNRFRSIAECESTCSERVASDIFISASELCHKAPSEELPQAWLITSPLIKSAVAENNTTDRELMHSLNSLFVPETLQIEPSCMNIGQMESRWYLDVHTGTCKEFAYTHCGGSPNNFLSRTDCEQFCGARKESLEDVCHFLPDSGPCDLKHSMWYFDPNYLQSGSRIGQVDKGACRTFAYSGCGGNSNRFVDQRSCEATCAKFREHLEWQDSELSEGSGAKQLGRIDGVDLSEIDDWGYFNALLSNTTSAEHNAVTEIGAPKNQELAKSVNLLSIDLEPCRRPAISGNCHPLNCSVADLNATNCTILKMQRWFFNAHTSNCEPFSYSGCGGSENTFDDAQSCQVACKARIVRPDRDRRCDSLPHQNKCYTLTLNAGALVGGKSNSTIAFHFSVESATCKAFQLDTSRPGCDPKPYFSNGHECLRACLKSSPTEKHLQNRCFARKTHSTGECAPDEQRVFRWSYLSELHQCVRFSQCAPHADESVQPGNNFASRAICETTCMGSSLEEVCQLPMDPGPCSANQPRYYYDTKAVKCRMFLYGGCLGNANRFTSRHECLMACSEFATKVMLPNVTSVKTVLHLMPTDSEAQATTLPVAVFELMRRVTQHHTDHFPWDLCLETHSYGTCPLLNGYHHFTSGFTPKQLTRYFYDRRLGKCQPFTYTGCGARGNHFDTQQDCDLVCERRLRGPAHDRCQPNVTVKLCPGSGLYGWLFNHSVGDCQAAELCLNSAHTGGMTNASSVGGKRLRRTSQWQSRTGPHSVSVYATRSACQYHCLPKPPRGTDAQNVCHMNPIVTVPFGCNAMITRWYFEPREAICRSYITCPQYGNNFASEKTCQEVCMPTHPLHVCRLPKDHGGCARFVARWYYDVRWRTCRPFMYGGCFGNPNRFLTRAECESFCVSQDVCRLPLQKHSADTTYPKRYYYNQFEHRCLPFHFTGILAHGNNFPDLAACNATCVFVPDVEAVISNAELPTEDNALYAITEEQLHLADKNVAHVTQESAVNRSVKEFHSPCASLISDLGPGELAKQTICDKEDIVHELGYRFRTVRAADKQFGGEGQSDGFCELTLVPICLSQPRKVFRSLVDHNMRTIGRVFQTQAECEETCLRHRRVRRSVNGISAESPQANHFEEDVKKLLEQSGYESEINAQQPVRNGCTPDSVAAERVDSFQHTFQAYTRWPCQFDTSEARNYVPLIERLEGSDAWLPCWVISAAPPVIRWYRLKDKKKYSVIPIRMPTMDNVWIAHYHKTQLHPLGGNGAWICQVTSADGKHRLEAFTQLHVVPKTQLYAEPQEVSLHSSMDKTVEHSVVVPAGGTLLLGCRWSNSNQASGAVRNEFVTWKRARSTDRQDKPADVKSLADAQVLYVRPVNTKLHGGLWFCRAVRHSTVKNERKLAYYVDIARPPQFLFPPSREVRFVSKHKPIQQLHCGEIDRGEPAARLTWYRCRRSRECQRIRSLTNANERIVKVTLPAPGERYFCRVENMWGRIERTFEFVAA